MNEAVKSRNPKRDDRRDALSARIEYIEVS
jgi:hypothetical protein